MSETIEIPPPIAGEDEDAYLSRVTEALVKAVIKAGLKLNVRLIRHAGQLLRGRRLQMDGFQKRLYDRWALPLDLFEICIYLASQCGRQANKYSEQGDSPGNKFLALIRLHANSVRIAEEIFVL